MSTHAVWLMIGTQQFPEITFIMEESSLNFSKEVCDVVFGSKNHCTDVCCLMFQLTIHGLIKAIAFGC